MRRRLLTSLICAACAGSLTMAPAYAQTDPVTGEVNVTRGQPASTVSGNEKLMPLEVIINGTPGGQWLLLERNGLLYAPEDAFPDWRLSRQPNLTPVEYRGQKWIPLNTIPGYEAKFNYANQSVELNFSPRAFEATRLTEEAARRPTLTPAIPALFLNYDLSHTGQSLRQAPGDQQLGALTELGISGNAGVLTSSYVGHNITGSSSQQRPNWRRLETTFTRDMLDDGLTLKLGDTSTRRGSWGRPVYFGGFQIGTNFGLNPGFISQPIPVIRGTSSAPSTVELYVNDVLRQTSRVPTGPFTIDNFPLLTSSGEARMVVRDALGRETVIDQPFFSHPSLLEEGLSDFSLEAGAVRMNLGTNNSDYGQRFASSMLRYGLSKQITLEAQGETGQDTSDSGLAASFALPLQILGQLSASTSADKLAGNGQSWRASLHKSNVRQNLSMSYERSTRGYRQIATGSATLPYRLQTSANYSHTLDAKGSFALGVARIGTYDRGDLTTYSGNYSLRVTKSGTLVLTFAKVTGSTPGYTLGASLLMPLDSQSNFTANATRRDGRNDGYVGASKNLGNDSGNGWRALAGNRTGQNFVEGGLYHQNDYGLFSADASASMQQQTLRLGAQGGIVMLDGHAFLTRRVLDSFALVEVAGYSGIGINFQNSAWAHTDEQGVALLPRLLPYQHNSIQLDPSELPINAELDSIEHVVTPASRTGVKVVFPVRSGRGALIRIVDAYGSDAPIGAIVTIEGDKEEFYVARRGEAFITGLKDENILHMKLDGSQSCSFRIKLPPSNPDTIPRIGPVHCVK